MKLELKIKQILEASGGELLSGNPEKFIDLIEIDSRFIFNPISSCFVCLIGNKFDAHDFIEELYGKGCRTFIVSKYVELKEANVILVDDTLKALQDIAAFHRSRFNIPVIGITGSNGKTIVKEWLYELLKHDFHIVRSPKSYNSQVGVALSVLEIRKEHNLGIFEAGISMDGEMEALEKMIQPSFGVFTGIGKAHSSGFKNEETKIIEKFKLFVNCHQLICEDQFTSYSNVEVDSWSKNAIEVKGKQSFIQLKEKELVVDFTTQFPMNLMNALVCASHFSENFDQHISELSSLALRLETENGRNGNIIINDSYSFDPDALKIALNYQYQHYPEGNKVFICSTPKKDMELEFINLIKQYQLDRVVLIGASSLDPKFDWFQDKKEFLNSELVSKIENSVILIKGYRKDHLEEISLELEEITHKTWLEIDLSALRNNIQFFRNQIPVDSKLLVMVKASAYGGGLDRIGAILEAEKIDYLGVAYPEEGVQLRSSGVHLPILVMNSEKATFDKLVQYQLEPSIYSFHILEDFIKYLIKKGIQNYAIHIKIETGMNRLGFTSSEIKMLLAKIVSQPEVHVKSVFSHLSASDDPNSIEWTNQQKEHFDAVCVQIQKGLDYEFIRHLYNTNAILNLDSSPYEMARMGIGLYGISEPQNTSLEAVLKLKTKITQIRFIEKGESVGYSRAFKAKRKMRIGVLAVGYADGLFRNYSKEGKVFVNGQKVPIVGNICMDMTMIDLSEIDAKENDEVEIFGDHIPVSELASKVGTIPYEIFTRISNRVKRIYLD